MTRDLGVAEDLAADAFVSALAQWPEEGIPRNPGAWLTTAAKRRAYDLFRREQTLAAKAEALQRDGPGFEPDFASRYEDIDDDMLRLTFVTCHPVLSQDARVALTLKLIGGLTTAEIARAYLTAESTIAQRIVRAKKTLSEAGVEFEVPSGPDRLQRLSSILEAIYLIFNEGYSASAGEDKLRPELVEDALRLGRMLGALMPHESEVHALVALMELQASRLPARLGPDGEPVLLLDQDRGRWNALGIRRGLEALARSNRLGAPRFYGLQAAIAACHGRALTAGETDWRRIAELYGELAAIEPSPVIELNRGVAVGMARGPQAGLAIVDALANDASLRTYHLLPSVRGDLLYKLGRLSEAQREFERAASLAHNVRDKIALLRRVADCAPSIARSPSEATL